MSSMARGSTCGGLVAGSVGASAVGYEEFYRSLLMWLTLIFISLLSLHVWLYMLYFIWKIIG